MDYTVYSMLTATVIIFIAFSGVAYAHPGNTAADGCHYCRTNCDTWGVPWNERHCHTPKVNTTAKTAAPSVQTTKNTPVQTQSSTQASSVPVLRSSSSRSTKVLSDTQMEEFMQALDEAKEQVPEESLLGSFLSAAAVIAGGWYAFRKMRKR